MPKIKERQILTICITFLLSLLLPLFFFLQSLQLLHHLPLLLARHFNIGAAVLSKKIMVYRAFILDLFNDRSIDEAINLWALAMIPSFSNHFTDIEFNGDVLLS